MGKKLVVYFSHTGENWQVGYINKGNTAIVAEIISELIGADVFEIEPVKEYPKKDHAKLIVEAKEEKIANVRPEIKKDIDLNEYDTIFLGFPNWWAELPMCVYTFLEKHDWKDKKIIPFVTHGGGGMQGIDKKIADICNGAILNTNESFEIEGKIAQGNPDLTKEKVKAWLKEIKMTK